MGALAHENGWGASVLAAPAFKAGRGQSGIIAPLYI